MTTRPRSRRSRIGGLEALLALVIADPTAFAPAHAHGAAQTIILTAMVLPLPGGVIVKAFAGSILFRTQGPINKTLMGLGTIDQPLPLPFTETALTIGAANMFPTVAAPPIHAAIRQIDPALSSAAVSLVLGTAVAMAVAQGRFPGRSAIATFSVSPLMTPGLLAGVALLQFLREMGLRDAYWSLLIGHILIALPFAMRTPVAAVASFDFSLIDAARTLGMSWPEAVLKVLAPNLAHAFLTAGLFAFLASMDNYPISIFLTDARNKTLPIKVLQYLKQQPDPTIAAIFGGLILMALIALIVGAREDGADLASLAGAPLAGLAETLAETIPDACPAVPLDPISEAVRQAETRARIAPRGAHRGRYDRPPGKPSEELAARIAGEDAD